MMRRESEPLQKVTINLYRADYNELKLLHADVDTSKVIRALIKQYLDRHSRARTAVSSTTPVLEVEGLDI